MAEWRKLTEYLREAGSSVTLTWNELEDIVGGLPPSATNHRPWWSGDRSHVRSWTTAGYRLARVSLGDRVWFVSDAPGAARAGHGVIQPVQATTVEQTGDSISERAPDERTTDVLLVTCVESKLDHPAAAKDLYISPRFRKQRQYAEALQVPWYILSAEHGLVRPTDWLAPYERYLPDTPSTYREAWGRWVVERLELLEGSLDGRTVEVHASEAYIRHVRPHLRARGAATLEPLRGLTQGQGLAWYTGRGTRSTPCGSPAPARRDSDGIVQRLNDVGNALSTAELRTFYPVSLATPGLYSWWVDKEGASDLTRNLGEEVHAGLIYVGQAGASSTQSGRSSAATLRSRLLRQHLGGNARSSTFRRTLMSILMASEAVHGDEAALTGWMERHLRVIPEPVASGQDLARLEEEILSRIDPPLNLRHMRPTAVRDRLRRLRAQAARRLPAAESHSEGGDTESPQ